MISFPADDTPGNLATAVANTNCAPSGCVLLTFNEPEGSALVDAWVKQEERGTDALLHERMIVLAGWILYVAVTLYLSWMRVERSKQRYWQGEAHLQATRKTSRTACPIIRTCKLSGHQLFRR